MGILDTNRSSTANYTDSRQATLSGDNGSFIGDGSTIYNQDADTTRRALDLAQKTVSEGLAAQRYAFDIANNANASAGSFAKTALSEAMTAARESSANVLQAKTDAGQSERILKIVAVTSAAALLGYMLLKK